MRAPRFVPLAAVAAVAAVAARAALAALAAGMLVTSAAQGAGPVGPNRSPIQTSDYAIDVYQGPIFAGTRITGLAGAYTAIAEDVDGNLQNPAAPAVRPNHSVDHFDYYLGLGLTLPAQLDGMDFFNSGGKTSISASPDSFVFLVPALNLQWGELGVGATVELQTYRLSKDATPGEQDAAFRATTAITHLQVAYGVDHNQLVFGAGTRLANFLVDNQLPRGEGGASFDSVGSGLEVGFLFKPEHLPFRLGAAFRSAVRTQASYSDTLLPDENGDITVADSQGNLFYLPRSVALPWDFNVGVAVQFGRPLNHHWRSIEDRIEREGLQRRLSELDREERGHAARSLPDAERRALEQELTEEAKVAEAALEKAEGEARRNVARELASANPFYLLLSASLVISGPAEDAVGVESFLTQEVNRSGRRTVYSPRLGAETEVVPRFLRVRAGTYLEPTRFETSDARVHGTLGIDVRVVRWNVFGLFPDDFLWRAAVAGDAANRFFTWGVGLGGWYPRDPAAGP